MIRASEAGLTDPAVHHAPLWFRVIAFLSGRLGPQFWSTRTPSGRVADARDVLAPGAHTFFGVDADKAAAPPQAEPWIMTTDPTQNAARDRGWPAGGPSGDESASPGTSAASHYVIDPDPYRQRAYALTRDPDAKVRALAGVVLTMCQSYDDLKRVFGLKAGEIARWPGGR